jgi:hypothetical protein
MSATFMNSTNQLAVLKELYPEDGAFLKDLVYRKNPGLALLPKDESPDGFAGKYIPVPTVYGDPMGRSASFANAQSNQTAVADVSFFVYVAKNYQLCSLQNLFIEQTKSKAGAFVDGVKLAMDKSFRNLASDMAHDLFSDGTGSRGAISSITSGVIVLTDPSQVTQFEVGMVLVSYSVSSLTATISTGGNLGYVIAVNRSFTAPTITVSATQGGSAGTPTNWSTSFPNLAVQGDVNFASGGLGIGNGLAQKMVGFGGWLPSTAPTTGDSFWGVDRSVDTRLSGVYLDVSAESIEEGIIDLATAVNLNGGEPDMCFINFSSYAALLKSLGSKVQYVQVEHDNADISFKAIHLQTPYGAIPVIPDRSVPAKTVYLLQMDVWKLRSLGKAPHILTYGPEGLEALRISTDDGLEIRLALYGNIICSAPGWNGRALLSQ